MGTCRSKAVIKRLALEVRAELDLAKDVPLDPYALADLYGVDVFPLDDVACSDLARQHFTVTRPESFSAALVPVGAGRVVVVENTAHAPVRRCSTMGHEMAHVLLEHAFGAMLVNEQGCRATDEGQEAEAAELGGELLVPFVALQSLARLRASDEAIALQFGVSVPFARWRANSTGARKIAARQAEAYRRRQGA